MYNDEDLLSLAGLADMVFCPRRAVLHRVDNRRIGTIMSQPAYAHSQPGQPPDKWHPLDEHLRVVAEKAGEFGQPVGAYSG